MVTALVVSVVLILAAAATRLVHRFEPPDPSRLTVCRGRRGRRVRFRTLGGRIQRRTEVCGCGRFHVKQ